MVEMGERGAPDGRAGVVSERWGQRPNMEATATVHSGEGRGGGAAQWD